MSPLDWMALVVLAAGAIIWVTWPARTRSRVTGVDQSGPGGLVMNTPGVIGTAPLLGGLGLLIAVTVVLMASGWTAAHEQQYLPIWLATTAGGLAIVAVQLFVGRRERRYPFTTGAAP